MNKLNMVVIAFASLTLVAGCGGSDGSSNGGNDNGSEQTSDNGDNDNSDDGSGTNIDWTGTWTVDLDYDVTCEVGPDEEEGSNQHSHTIELTGSNSSLSMRLDNYEMSGTGDSESLRLNGDFPVRDYMGEPAGINSTQYPNNVSFTIDEITDADNASGTMSGDFEGEYGSCTIENGQATFSR